MLQKGSDGQCTQMVYRLYCYTEMFSSDMKLPEINADKGYPGAPPLPWNKEPGKKMDSPIEAHKCIHSPLRGSPLISTSVATGQAGGEVLTHSTGEDRNHSCSSEGGQGGGEGYVEYWDLVRPFPHL